MRNVIVILSLILWLGAAFAYEKTYINPPNTERCYYNPPYRVKERCLNPYSNPNFNPYLRNRMYLNRNPRSYYNFMKLQRLKNSYLTWDNLRNHNPWSKGSLTGYSVPVTDDIYNQMGIAPYDPSQQNQRMRSSVKTQELYSMPTGNETYYRNGRLQRDLGGISGTTGVTIIYD